MHSGEILYDKDNIQVINCPTCGFAHISPYPTPDEIPETDLDSLYGRYQDWVESSKEDEEWLALGNGDKLANFKQLLQFQSVKDKKILDVGCGLGYFLRQSKKSGWDPYGVEPGKNAVKYCLDAGLKVSHGYLGDEGILDKTKFDALHLGKVIEHVPEPDRLIQKCSKVLKSGGVMCLEAPNDFNIFQNSIIAQFKHKKYWVDPRQHVNYFNFDSLENLLERNGFKILLRDASFPLEWFILMGRDYVSDPAVGRSNHLMRSNFELNLERFGHSEFRRELYQYFAKQGIGRLAIIYGMKI